MTKYSYEFKKKVVEAYLKGEGGYEYLCKKYGVKAHGNIERWVAAYKHLGDKGLMNSQKNKNYPLQFKLSVVESYLTSELSYQELAVQSGMNDSSLIVRWVNDYRAAGPDALKPKKKGRNKTLKKATTDVKAAESSGKANTDAKRIKELEAELLKLQIENALLKESRRLRLEEEALLKKRRELSTVSEDNSN